jgi:phospholipid/cholesterol/gamma-HCH transport system substrate-binding protein
MLNLKTESIVGIFVAVALGVLFYMTYQLGAIRFDRSKYQPYYVYFTDVLGLRKKDEVKMAGVKVGWIDKFDLEVQDHRVKATLMITVDCKLHEGATAAVRQEDLLGGRYVELMTGNPSRPRLPVGAELARGEESASFDSMLSQARSIATHVENLTSTVCATQNVEAMQKAVVELSKTVSALASVAQAMDKIITRNEQTLDTVVKDVGKLVENLNTQIPAIAHEIRDLTKTLSKDLVPSVKNNIDQVAKTIDKNVCDVATKCNAATESITKVTDKLNDGTGTLGQLLNDRQVYDDVKDTLDGVKDTLSMFKDVTYMADPHVESMLSKAEHTNFKDFKAYFDFRIYPSDSCFFLFGPEYRQSGAIFRNDFYGKFIKPPCKHQNCESVEPGDKGRCQGLEHAIVRSYDQWLWNVQFGKVFGPCSLRAGLFESTPGVGIDVDVIPPNDYFRWITTFEAYDFRGRLRIDDDRPHLKWWNRVFLTNNLYFVFGVDDFISRRNKSVFLGAGVRFTTEDISYLLSQANINF